jgi:preprotein translocase subunit SecG
MTFLLYLTVTLFVIVCIFLILLVLIQKGRGGGLASAFGGAGGNTAFGSKTGDVLTWATSIVFGIFLLLAVAANLLANRIDTLRKTGSTSTTPSPASATPGPLNPASPQSSFPKPMNPEIPPANNNANPTTNPAPADLPPRTGGQ